jgi:hypothetical protein
MSPKSTRQLRLVATGWLPMLALEMAVPMLVQAMDSEDLYRLCAAFPRNLQCRGYAVSVPLSQRSGKTVERPEQQSTETKLTTVPETLNIGIVGYARTQDEPLTGYYDVPITCWLKSIPMD